MSAIKYFAGYEPFYYYLVSFIFRVLAGVSIFFLVRFISQKQTIAVLTSAFFVISYTGIQSSDWVFNFYHYIGIIVQCLFLVIYWRTKERATLPLYLLSGIFFMASLVTSPNRMHGLFPLLLVIEFSWFLVEVKKYNIKRFLIRFFSLIICYKIVFSGAGYGSTEYNLSQITNGLELATDLISKNQTWFLLNPLTTLGNYILPDKLYSQIPFQSISVIGKPPLTFFSYLFFIYLIFSVVTSFILKIADTRRFKVLLYIAAGLIWSVFIRFFYSFNQEGVAIQHSAFTLIGGLTIIFSLFLFFQLRQKLPRLAQLTLISLGWMITFTLFPWLIAPYTYLDTSLRYSLQQSIGLSIWLSIMIYLLLDPIVKTNLTRLSQAIGILLLIFLIIINLQYSNDFFNTLNTHRSNLLDKKLWGQLTSAVPEIDKNSASVFYLKYDDAVTAEVGLRALFPARSAMHYQITDQNNVSFIIYDYADLKSIVTDGQAWSKQGTKIAVTPLNQVYAFELKNNQLIDITSQVRQQLMPEISNYAKNQVN